MIVVHRALRDVIMYDIINYVLVVCLYREPAGPAEVSYMAKYGGSDSRIQAAGLSGKHDKPSLHSKTCQNSTSTSLNRSTDFVKKPGLRSRTRSLDHVKTSNLKDVSAKNLHLNVKRSDVKVGRSRSQSEDREETQKSSATKSQTRMKLTIPHTPQLLK